MKRTILTTLLLCLACTAVAATTIHMPDTDLIFENDDTPEKATKIQTWLGPLAVYTTEKTLSELHESFKTFDRSETVIPSKSGTLVVSGWSQDDKTGEHTMIVSVSENTNDMCKKTIWHALRVENLAAGFRPVIISEAKLKELVEQDERFTWTQSECTANDPNRLNTLDQQKTN